MNKKMMMIGGGILVVAVTLILIFTLSGGSSTRDMIVGKWESPRGVLQLDDDGTAYAPGPRGDLQGTWSLGGDEKILTITMEDKSEEFGLSSVSENKLCLLYQGDIKCFNKFGSNNGEEKASDYEYYGDEYYEEEAAGDEDGYEDYYYEEEVEEERYYDVYGREHNHISTCYTCGISYTVQTLPYLGKYCSQTCCGAYERDLRDCGY